MFYKNKYQILLSNIAIFMVGNLLSKALVFLLMPFYTSILSIEHYGTSELYISMIEIIFPIATLSIIEALYRFSIDQNNLNELFSNSILIVLSGSAIFALIAIIIYYTIYPYQYIKEFILLYFTFTFYALTTQFSRGLGHVKRYAMYGVFNVMLLIFTSYYFLSILKLDVIGYLLSFSLSYGFTAILAFLISKEYKYILPFRLNICLMKEMLNYSIPSIPNMISWWINNTLNRYIILFFLGINSAGLYIAATKLPSIINLASTIFQKAWQYSAAKEINSPQKSLFFKNVFNTYKFICFTLCFIIISIIEPLSYFILGKNFFSAWRFIPFLLIAATLGCLSTYFGSLYNALKENKNLMLSTIYGSIIGFLLNIILIPTLGIFGASISTMLSYGSIVYFRFSDLNKRLNLCIDKKTIIIEVIILAIYSVYILYYNSHRLYIVDIFLFLCIIYLNKKTLNFYFLNLLKRIKQFN
ncbi:lipopolysaccharide biosynthesis protein [Avibacterium avium]|uniref:lipopolysaccharide biosynthesis protein n=1 Tax=Avibacterium avium TaxID=751 RepID=UPI003BF8228E